jgi:hypothetical protein
MPDGREMKPAFSLGPGVVVHITGSLQLNATAEMGGTAVGKAALAGEATCDG